MSITIAVEHCNHQSSFQAGILLLKRENIHFIQILIQINRRFSINPNNISDIARNKFFLSPFHTGSVRIYDFGSNSQLSVIKFNQGGTALTWAPAVVSFPSMLAEIHQGDYELASIQETAHQTRH